MRNYTSIMFLAILSIPLGVNFGILTSGSQKLAENAQVSVAQNEATSYLKQKDTDWGDGRRDKEKTSWGDGRRDKERASGRDKLPALPGAKVPSHDFQA